MTNQYPGLWRGPIDHEAGSIINAIAATIIPMGASVSLVTSPSNENLPRVSAGGDDNFYGVVVGGDNDGVYPPPAQGFEFFEENFAATEAGQGVVVVTQGRCIATVRAVGISIVVGGPLQMDGGNFLRNASSGEEVVARALLPIEQGETDIIPVDIQREGSIP